MDTRLNIFTQTEQVEFIPVFLCHSQFIEYRHYCLSLARPNDVKIIIVRGCHGLSWNLKNILFNRKRQGKMGSLLVRQLFIWEPLNIFIVVFSSVSLNKNKINSEKHTEIFLEFLVFHKQANKKGKAKTRRTIYTGKLPTSKRRTKNFGFSF